MTRHTQCHGLAADRKMQALVRQALRCARGHAESEMHPARQALESRRAWEDAVLWDESPNPDLILQRA